MQPILARRAPLWLALVVASLALPSVAGAAVTQSQITTPADPVFRIYDDDKPVADPANTFTVSGTSNGTAGDPINIRCFYSDEDGNLSSNLYATTAVVAGGGFSVAVVDKSTGNETCRMRAVPNSYNDVDVPDFKGPVTNIARVETTQRAIVGPPGNLVTTDFTVSTGGTRGGLEWDSVSSCGPYGWYAYVNSSFGQTDYEGFDCALSLFNDNDSSTSPRSEIKIDGKNAFTSSGLPNQSDPDAGGPQVAGRPTGTPSIGVAITRDGADVTSVEDEPIVTCGAAATYPANGTNCPTATGTGVSYKRTITTGDGGLKALVTDVWTSTDGAAHALDLLYDTYNDGDYGPSYLFGGESGFSVFAGGDEPSLGSQVPGSIVARDRETDDGTNNSASALTYVQQPQGARFVDDEQYQLTQLATVPAGGSITYRWVLQTRRTGDEAEAAAKQAEDGLDVPKVAITAPAGGSTVQDAAVTVSGTASDNGGVASLTLNGAAVALSGGAFSVPRTLVPGANTFTAVATDNAGNSTSAVATVTYVPRPAAGAPGVIPRAAAVCKVPRIRRGSTYGSTRSKITKAGCTPGRVTRVRSKTKKGRVVSTSPSSGTRPAGTRVSIKLSSGPAKKKPARRR